MYQNELYHHGVKGQKWGVRRYQNSNGTLTAKGKKRLYKDLNTIAKADKSENKDKSSLTKSKVIEGLSNIVRNDTNYKNAVKNTTKAYTGKRNQFDNFRNKSISYSNKTVSKLLSDNYDVSWKRMKHINDKKAERMVQRIVDNMVYSDVLNSEYSKR